MSDQLSVYFPINSIFIASQLWALSCFRHLAYISAPNRQKALALLKLALWHKLMNNPKLHVWHSLVLRCPGLPSPTLEQARQEMKCITELETCYFQSSCISNYYAKGSKFLYCFVWSETCCQGREHCTTED